MRVELSVILLTAGGLTLPFPTRAADWLAPSSRDALFRQEPPIVCNDPIRNSHCAGLCTDMKLPFDERKDVVARDINTKRGFARPEYFELKGLRQRKIKISSTPPNPVTELNKIPEGKLFTWEDAVAADQNQPPTEAGHVASYEVGNPDAASTCKWATVWVHGATPVVGGLGVADNLFGGQFNRMRHLAVDNDGMYYSPSLEDFGNTNALRTIVKRIRTKTCPRGKIILNCGSAGTSACWDLVADERAARQIGGMVLIGSGAGPSDAKSFLSSPIAKARVPILFAHGEKDGPEHWHDLVLKIHEQDPTYPIRFVNYATGGHMTPLRMLDWRATMNCMLDQAPSPHTEGVSSVGVEKSSSAR